MYKGVKKQAKEDISPTQTSHMLQYVHMHFIGLITQRATVLLFGRGSLETLAAAAAVATFLEPTQQPQQQSLMRNFSLFTILLTLHSNLSVLDVLGREGGIKDLRKGSGGELVVDGLVELLLVCTGVLDVLLGSIKVGLHGGELLLHGILLSKDVD